MAEKIIEIFYLFFKLLTPLYFIGYLGIYKSRFVKNRSLYINANLLFGVGSATLIAYFDTIKRYIFEPNFLKDDPFILDNVNLFIGLFLFLIFGFLPIIIGMFLILKNNKE